MWVWLATLTSLVLYGLVAGFTLHEIGLSPDTVSAWATDAPHRTVLCVPADASEGLQVAADPTTADRESVRAPLESSERSSSLGPFGLHLRQHTYRLTVSAFGVELPWMKNDYTAGWTDLPAHLAWTVARSPRAGQAVHLVLGGLVVLVCCLFAGRLGGWPASLMTGLWLATDPWFLVYKRLVGGHEVVLQILVVLAVSLLGAAYLRRRPALLHAGMFVCGLGLHVKPSFAAVVAGLAVGVGVAGSWGWRGRSGVGRTVAVASLVLSLGAAPGALAWVASSALTPTETTYQGEASASARWAILANGLDRRRDDIKTRTTALDVLLHPDTFWARHWHLVGARTAQTEPDPNPPRSLASWASSWLALLLVFVATLGAGSLARRRWLGEETAESRIALGVIATAIAMPIPLRILSPDPHHLALWTPVLAMALGLSLAAAGLRRRWLPIILFALALMLPLRVQTLREIDEQTAAMAGRLSTAGGQARLAATLKGRGFLAPAMLDYTVMSLMEAWSEGEVRPWLYGRAAVSRRRGCLGGAHPEFLPRILEAHVGGQVVIVAGMTEVEGGRPDPYRSSEQMARAALAAQVQVRRVQVVVDERDRWMADVWAIEPGSEPKGSTTSRLSPPGGASAR